MANRPFANKGLLQVSRMILPEQLQSLYTDAALAGKYRLAVRIRLRNDSGEEWHDVQSNSGLRITPDGIIWLDGLTDDQLARGANNDLLYTGSLASPSTVELKDIKMNIAIYTDTRVSGLSGQEEAGSDSDKDKVQVLDEVDPSVQAGGEGNALQRYVFSPDSYRYEGQAQSRPARKVREAGLVTYDESGEAADSDPYERPLQDDHSKAQEQAARELREHGKIKRNSSWRLIGIRPEYAHFPFIDSVQFIGASGSYEVGEPLQSVTFDFDGQFTDVVPA